MNVNGTTFTFGADGSTCVIINGERRNQHVEVNYNFDGGSVSTRVTGNLQNVNNSSQSMAGENITIRRGEILKRDIRTCNGPINVQGEGTLVGDVQSMNGPIRIGGSLVINGRVDAANGPVDVVDNVVINGSVNNKNGPTFLRDEVVVKGNVLSQNGDIFTSIVARVEGITNTVFGSKYNC